MGRFDGRDGPLRVRYEPTSVKDLLVEMKDTAELLIDLSYSAVLHGSPTIAHEVVELEHRMDVLQMRARMSSCSRGPEPGRGRDAGAGTRCGSARPTRSPTPPATSPRSSPRRSASPTRCARALTEGVETLVRGTVSADSAYAGRTLKDIDLESKTGVRVIAIRREDDWIFNPGPKTQIEVGDVTLLRGPKRGSSMSIRR